MPTIAGSRMVARLGEDVRVRHAVVIARELQRADHAVEVDDAHAAEHEHAVEREQPAARGLRVATILDLDATQPVVCEEPAAIARVERGDRVAAAAQERHDLRPARGELHELTARDVEPDAVALATRAAAAALVAKAAIGEREVDVGRHAHTF